jgi:thiamine pyrophosphokinase
MKFAILLNGPLQPTLRLKQQVLGCRSIAADGGIVHAQALDLEPELWVGDFDSAPIASYTTPRQVFPVDKDQTDGEIAVQKALEKGAQEMVLVGALGGRLDQTLAHIALAIRLAQQGLSISLSNGTQEAYPVVAGRIAVDLPPQTPFSIVAFSKLEGLTLGGARWPLVNTEIELGSTCTISNVVLQNLWVSLAKGHGVLIAELNWSNLIGRT